MGTLPRPMDLLELADNQVLQTRITGWTEGTVNIFPGGWEQEVTRLRNSGALTPDEAVKMLREGKEIPALRVLVPRENKRDSVPYWDITSTRLIAQLLPYLKDPNYKTRTFRVTAHGVAPRKTFTLEVS